MVKTVRDNNNNNLPFEFTNYDFTGTLRPCKKSIKKTVNNNISRPDYASDINGKSKSEENDKKTNTNIKIYTTEEINKIKEVCKIGRKVLDIGSNALRVGITCDEIDTIVHNAIIAENCYPSPLNYYLFPKSICTSVNEVICHGIPDEYILQDGDIINLDISVYKDGFHADLNETFFIGDKAINNKDNVRLIECAYNTLSTAINNSKPGTMYRDLGNKINDVAKLANCSVVTSYCGHGIGNLFHTAPTIPHYANNKAKGSMAVGHIFTIEPMINLGTYNDVLWPDGWTAVTADGKRSAQFEHTMVVTTNGVELLTAREGEPIDRMPPFDPLKFKR